MEGESSEGTIGRFLLSYQIGEKLRRLRLRKKMGLVALGKHTGLSAGMLSQLENGRLVPTLPTLSRIAMVFDVGLDHFFSAKGTRKPFGIVRAAERIRFPERADAPAPAYFFECLAFATQDKKLHAYLAEFPKRAAARVPVHFHEGAEFIYVLDGALGVTYEEEEHVLKAGDSVYFDGAEPHGYRGASPKPARAIVITAPGRV